MTRITDTTADCGSTASDNDWLPTIARETGSFPVERRPRLAGVSRVNSSIANPPEVDVPTDDGNPQRAVVPARVSPSWRRRVSTVVGDAWRFWGVRLSEPEIYDVLQNQRRRQTLRVLREQTGVMPLEELAGAIAAAEAADTRSGTDLHRSVYNSLQQTHLPKLAAIDVVAYDEETNLVRLTTNAREVSQFLGVRPVWGLTWTEIYRVLATACLLAALSAELDLWVFGAFNEVLLLSTLLAIVALSTVCQIWPHRWVYLRTLLR